MKLFPSYSRWLISIALKFRTKGHFHPIYSLYKFHHKNRTTYIPEATCSHYTYNSFIISCVMSSEFIKPLKRTISNFISKNQKLENYFSLLLLSLFENEYKSHCIYSKFSPIKIPVIICVIKNLYGWRDGIFPFHSRYRLIMQHTKSLQVMN